MSADPSSVSVQELYSLLVPLTGTRLIVPRVCVAEVTGVGQLRLLEEDPAWLVGTVGWKGQEIPLVSFEAACGEPMPELGNRSRAVIFHASEGLRPGYFAVMSQGLPQLVRGASALPRLTRFVWRLSRLRWSQKRRASHGRGTCSITRMYFASPRSTPSIP